MMKDVAPPKPNVLSGGDPASPPPSEHHAPRGTLTARDTADVAEAVRDAGASGTALRLRGAGTWLDAGRPVSAPHQTLDLGAVRGIIEYVPGDLTLTARAGTSLAEIDAATLPHGQWFPLDPFGDPCATLGATLATASCGPLASSQGLPRDLALGLEFVDGRGIAVRGGGRVVKNVAGFDLVRLTVGAWGTLGVITEATVRLRARPEHDVTIAVPLPRDLTALATLLRTLRSAALTPLAMELVDASLAAALGAGEDEVVLVRLTGNAASVTAQQQLVESLGASRRLPPSTWSALRDAEPAGAATVRLSGRPSRLASLWHTLGATVAPLHGAMRHATVERGIIRLIVPNPVAHTLADVLRPLTSDWNVVGERLPVQAWRVLADDGADPLSQGARSAFDPLRLLNPGIFTSGT